MMLNALVCFIEWLNDNSGAVMAVLTTAYVGATVWLCFSNSRTTQNAISQLNEMKMARKQDTIIHLHEKRYVYMSALQGWESIVNMARSDKILGTEEATFLGMVLDIPDYEIHRVREINELIRSAEEKYKSFNEVDKKKLQERVGEIREERNLRIIMHLMKEESHMGDAEYFFMDIDMAAITAFCNAYVQMTINKSEENWSKLKKAHDTLVTANVLYKMKQQMKFHQHTLI